MTLATPTYTLLDSVTLASSAASVTFSSITQDYRDLVLVVEGLGVSAGFFGYRFNSDSGANYNSLVAIGDGSSGSSFGSSGDNIGYIGGQYSTTVKTLSILQIMDYSATDKHKSVIARNNRADGFTAMAAGRWASTAAITSIYLDFTNTALDFDTGSTFYLYGIEA